MDRHMESFFSTATQWVQCFVVWIGFFQFWLSLKVFKFANCRSVYAALSSIDMGDRRRNTGLLHLLRPQFSECDTAIPWGYRYLTIDSPHTVLELSFTHSVTYCVVSLRLSYDATLLVTGLPPLSLGLYVHQRHKNSGTAHAPGQDPSSMSRK